MFKDQLIRKAFIKKVYFILSIQLLITVGIISIFVLIEDLQNFVAERPALILIAMFVTLATMSALACCSNVRREVPINYMCLGWFTVAEAFLLGVISSIYDPYVVLIAVGLTAAICLALTIFAMQTKYDFTVMAGFLLVCLIVGLIFSLLMIFFHNRILQIIYGSLGVILFSMYLIFDTQLMLGGQHQYSIGPDEYVFAALNLYVDVVQIFMCILRLFVK